MTTVSRERFRFLVFCNRRTEEQKIRSSGTSGDAHGVRAIVSHRRRAGTARAETKTAE